MRIEGIGHAFWVDAGAHFAESAERDLIHYLLTFRPRAAPTTAP